MKLLAEIVELARRIEGISYYELLGVKNDCPASEIVDRYYLLAPKLHPDRFVRRCNDEQMTALTRVSARLGEARRVLSSVELRKSYDEGLARGNMRLASERKIGKKGLKDEKDPRSPVARQFLDQAIKLLDEKDYRKARSAINLAVKYEPKSPAIQEVVRRLDEATAPTRKARGEAAVAEPVVAPAEEPADDAPAVIHDGPPLLDAAPAIAPPVLSAPSPVPVKLRAKTIEQVETLVNRELSIGGMVLKAAKPLPVGTPIVLQVGAPGGVDFEIPAHVTQVLQQGEPGGPGIGIKFGALEQDAIDKISALMSETNRAVATTPPPVVKLELEWLVGELLRLRSLPPRQVLGVDEAATSRQISKAFQDCSRRFQPGKPDGADAQAIVDACREILALFRSAYQELSQATPNRPSKPPTVDAQ